MTPSRLPQTIPGPVVVVYPDQARRWVATALFLEAERLRKTGGSLTAEDFALLEECRRLGGVQQPAPGVVAVDAVAVSTGALSVKEAAQRLCVNERTVTRWAKQGVISGRKVRGMWEFDALTIDQCAAGVELDQRSHSDKPRRV